MSSIMMGQSKKTQIFKKTLKFFQQNKTYICINGVNEILKEISRDISTVIALKNL